MSINTSNKNKNVSSNVQQRSRNAQVDSNMLSDQDDVSNKPGSSPMRAARSGIYQENQEYKVAGDDFGGGYSTTKKLPPPAPLVPALDSTKSSSLGSASHKEDEPINHMRQGLEHHVKVGLNRPTLSVFSSMGGGRHSSSTEIEFFHDHEKKDAPDSQGPKEFEYREEDFQPLSAHLNSKQSQPGGRRKSYSDISKRSSSATIRTADRRSADVQTSSASSKARSVVQKARTSSGLTSTAPTGISAMSTGAIADRKQPASVLPEESSSEIELGQAALPISSARLSSSTYGTFNSSQDQPDPMHRTRASPIYHGQSVSSTTARGSRPGEIKSEVSQMPEGSTSESPSRIAVSASSVQATPTADVNRRDMIATSSSGPTLTRRPAKILGREHVDAAHSSTPVAAATEMMKINRTGDAVNSSLSPSLGGRAPASPLGSLRSVARFHERQDQDQDRNHPRRQYRRASNASESSIDASHHAIEVSLRQATANHNPATHVDPSLPKDPKKMSKRQRKSIKKQEAIMYQCIQDGTLPNIDGRKKYSVSSPVLELNELFDEGDEPFDQSTKPRRNSHHAPTTISATGTHSIGPVAATAATAAGTAGLMGLYSHFNLTQRPGESSRRDEASMVSAKKKTPDSGRIEVKSSHGSVTQTQDLHRHLPSLAATVKRPKVDLSLLPEEQAGYPRSEIDENAHENPSRPANVLDIVELSYKKPGDPFSTSRFIISAPTPSVVHRVSAESVAPNLASRFRNPAFGAVNVKERQMPFSTTSQVTSAARSLHKGHSTSAAIKTPKINLFLLPEEQAGYPRSDVGVDCKTYPVTKLPLVDLKEIQLKDAHRNPVAKVLEKQIISPTAAALAVTASSATRSFPKSHATGAAIKMPKINFFLFPEEQADYPYNDVKVGLQSYPSTLLPQVRIREVPLDDALRHPHHDLHPTLSEVAVAAVSQGIHSFSHMLGSLHLPSLNTDVATTPVDSTTAATVAHHEHPFSVAFGASKTHHGAAIKMPKTNFFLFPEEQADYPHNDDKSRRHSYPSTSLPQVQIEEIPLDDSLRHPHHDLHPTLSEVAVAAVSQGIHSFSHMLGSLHLPSVNTDVTTMPVDSTTAATVAHHEHPLSVAFPASKIHHGAAIKMPKINFFLFPEEQADYPHNDDKFRRHSYPSTSLPQVQIEEIPLDDSLRHPHHDLHPTLSEVAVAAVSQGIHSFSHMLGSLHLPSVNTDVATTPVDSTTAATVAHHEHPLSVAFPASKIHHGAAIKMPKTNFFLFPEEQADYPHNDVKSRRHSYPSTLLPQAQIEEVPLDDSLRHPHHDLYPALSEVAAAAVSSKSASHPRVSKDDLELDLSLDTPDELREEAIKSQRRKSAETLGTSSRAASASSRAAVKYLHGSPRSAVVPVYIDPVKEVDPWNLVPVSSPILPAQTHQNRQTQPFMEPKKFSNPKEHHLRFINIHDTGSTTAEDLGDELYFSADEAMSPEIPRQGLTTAPSPRHRSRSRSTTRVSFEDMKPCSNITKFMSRRSESVSVLPPNEYALSGKGVMTSMAPSVPAVSNVRASTAATTGAGNNNKKETKSSIGEPSATLIALSRETSKFPQVYKIQLDNSSMPQIPTTQPFLVSDPLSLLAARSPATQMSTLPEVKKLSLTQNPAHRQYPLLRDPTGEKLGLGRLKATGGQSSVPATMPVLGALEASEMIATQHQQPNDQIQRSLSSDSTPSAMETLADVAKTTSTVPNFAKTIAAPLMAAAATAIKSDEVLIMESEPRPTVESIRSDTSASTPRHKRHSTIGMASAHPPSARMSSAASTVMSTPTSTRSTPSTESDFMAAPISAPAVVAATAAAAGTASASGLTREPASLPKSLTSALPSIPRDVSTSIPSPTASSVPIQSSVPISEKSAIPALAAATAAAAGAASASGLTREPASLPKSMANVVPASISKDVSTSTHPLETPSSVPIQSYVPISEKSAIPALAAATAAAAGTASASGLTREPESLPKSMANSVPTTISNEVLTPTPSQETPPSVPIQSYVPISEKSAIPALAAATAAAAGTASASGLTREPESLPKSMANTAPESIPKDVSTSAFSPATTPPIRSSVPTSGKSTIPTLASTTAAAGGTASASGLIREPTSLPKSSASASIPKAVSTSTSVPVTTSAPIQSSAPIFEKRAIPTPPATTSSGLTRDSASLHKLVANSAPPFIPRGGPTSAPSLVAATSAPSQSSVPISERSAIPALTATTAGATTTSRLPREPASLPKSASASAPATVTSSWLSSPPLSAPTHMSTSNFVPASTPSKSWNAAPTSVPAATPLPSLTSVPTPERTPRSADVSVPVAKVNPALAYPQSSVPFSAPKSMPNLASAPTATSASIPRASPSTVLSTVPPEQQKATPLKGPQASPITQSQYTDRNPFTGVDQNVDRNPYRQYQQQEARGRSQDLSQDGKYGIKDSGYGNTDSYQQGTLHNIAEPTSSFDSAAPMHVDRPQSNFMPVNTGVQPAHIDSLTQQQQQQQQDYNHHQSLGAHQGPLDSEEGEILSDMGLFTVKEEDADEKDVVDTLARPSAAQMYAASYSRKNPDVMGRQGPHNAPQPATSEYTMRNASGAQAAHTPTYGPSPPAAPGTAAVTAGAATGVAGHVVSHTAPKEHGATPYQSQRRTVDQHGYEMEQHRGHDVPTPVQTTPTPHTSTPVPAPTSNAATTSSPANRGGPAPTAQGGDRIVWMKRTTYTTQEYDDSSQARDVSTSPVSATVKSTVARAPAEKEHVSLWRRLTGGRRRSQTTNSNAQAPQPQQGNSDIGRSTPAR